MQKVAVQLGLSSIPSVAEIEAKLIEIARGRIKETAILYVKNEVAFEAGNFSLSISIPAGSSNTQIIDALNSSKDQLISDHQTKFTKASIETRFNFWCTELENSISSGWSVNARKLFYGRTIYNEIQAWLLHSRKANLWEVIISEESDPICLDTVKTLKDILLSI